MTEKPHQDWEGTPLQMYHDGIYPRGIEEIIIEFDTGDEEVLKPRLRGEFGAYELQQTALYIKALEADLRAREE